LLFAEGWAVRQLHMYVFRHWRRLATTAELLSSVADALSCARGPESETAALLAAAKLECALADYLAKDEDDIDEPRRCAAQFVRKLARDFVGSSGEHVPTEGALKASRGLALRGGEHNWRSELARIAWLMPPPSERLAVSDPEGFRYYGLFPQAYIRPARELARGLKSQRACVIGLRTIGSALAPVVAAALEHEDVDVRLFTVRPRGEPFDRHYRVAVRLTREIAQFDGGFVIVDEGPGLSGSSFTAAANWLLSLGVTRDRITLMPSWNAPAANLVNSEARRDWEQWRKRPAESLAPPAPDATDLSAGKWRGIFPTGAPVAVWPQQERAKFLLSDGQSMLKFAGVGSYAREMYERARQLSACGFAPPVAYESDGWLRYRRLAAHPVAGNGHGHSFAEWTGRYLAFIRSHYALGQPQPPSAELQLMTRSNLELLLRRPAPALPADSVPVMLDGHMLPHEFGLVDGALVKFDGVEHGDDHFFPGPADIAWDLAAVEVEFGPEIGVATLDEYVRRSGDTSVRRRLPWHRVAYTAFRTAWCRFAAERVDEPDRTLFNQQQRRYLTLLSRLTAMKAS
jgi:hypothetical protein